MKLSIKKGLGFGTTSGVITTLGLLVGLNSSTHDLKVIIGGILVIAVADSLSDALGVHISEESDSKTSLKDIWLATSSTFITKLFIASSFIIPLLLLKLNSAVILNIIWGAILLTIFSFYIAKKNNSKAPKVVLEHLSIATLVVVATFFIGELVNKYIN